MFSLETTGITRSKAWLRTCTLMILVRTLTRRRTNVTVNHIHFFQALERITPRSVRTVPCLDFNRNHESKRTEVYKYYLNYENEGEKEQKY